MAKHLHIISFNVPFPANYGGVIDVFHKIRWLHEVGIKVHLHCFHYGRNEAKKLEQYCESVHYYPRRSFLSNFSELPYIVNSRRHPALLQRLLQDEYPILFEGLHCCYLMNHESLKGRMKIFRESNIEHEYYEALLKNEAKWWKKFYFKFEAYRLQKFESVLAHANQIVTVSEKDAEYFKQKFTKNKVTNIPSFHENDFVTTELGKGDFILFHGNLSVVENSEAAKFLIEKVAIKSNYKFIIAGLNPSSELKECIQKAAKKNITLVENPNDETMNKLMHSAHIHFLYTHQTTGLKLKLINSLYKGKFVLLNDKMLHGVDVGNECIIANDENSFVQKIDELMLKNFMPEQLEQRNEWVKTKFNNEQNCEKLLSLIYS
ncbi:MAG: hypothetical protein RL065_538 [Bacteroidota bacterium]